MASVMRQITNRVGGLRGRFSLALFCVIVAVARSVGDRTDANWDLQNYHLYGPFAALHQRVGKDYFVAGIQGYFNPLADFPYYIAKFILFPTHPVLVAMLAGLPFALLAFATFKIARIYLASLWEAALAAILGLTGAVTLSEVGTSYDDVLIAAILLLGLWAASIEWAGLPRILSIAGLAAGCAAGLKLTALIFAPGLLIFCVMQAGNWRQAILSGFGFCVAFGIGFLAVWGWWGDVLWRHFHNPFFPLFGEIFHSPWSPAVSIRDARFYPRDTWQWLFYPFFWLQGRSFIVSEEPLRDPRFALVYLAMAVRLGAMVFGKAPRPSRMTAAFWVFFVITYGLWLIGFSILRYVIALEVLSGIAIWTALRPMIGARSLLALAVICLGCIAFTKPMSWGRIRYSQALVEAPIPVIAPDSLVFVEGVPLGFVIPYLYRKGATFVSPGWSLAGSAAFAAVRQRAAKGKNIFVLTNLPQASSTVASINTQLSLFDLKYREAACQPVRSPVQQTIRICKVEPQG